MKMKFKRTGDWQAIRTMFLRRRERMTAMRKRMMRDLTKSFADEVKEAIPEGTEMKAYKDSIETRRVTGSMKDSESAFAIISDPKPLKLQDLNPESYVIYAVPAGASTDFYGQLLIQYSPWVKDRLPLNYADAQGVRFVHRKVTEDETKRLTDVNDRVLKDNKVAFRRALAQLPPKPEKEIEQLRPPESMPDIMFMALRMEFGIQSRHVPHWGRAYRHREKILRRVLKDKKKYSRFVMDPNFNGWVQRMKQWKSISPQKFKTQYGKFEKAIVK